MDMASSGEPPPLLHMTTLTTGQRYLSGVLCSSGGGWRRSQWTGLVTGGNRRREVCRIHRRRGRGQWRWGRWRCSSQCLLLLLLVVPLMMITFSRNRPETTDHHHTSLKLRSIHSRGKRSRSASTLAVPLSTTGSVLQCPTLQLWFDFDSTAIRLHALRPFESTTYVTTGLTYRDLIIN